MTVKYLQSLQRHQMVAAANDDPTVLGKYRAGFSECAQEVSRYVTNVNGIDNNVKLRLLDHLARSMQRIDVGGAPHPNILPAPIASPAYAVATAVSSFPAAAATSGSTGSSVAQTIQTLPSGYVLPADLSSGALTVQPVQGHSVQQMNADVNCTVTSAGTRILGGLHVIPGRLPTGELAFVVPGNVSGQLIPLYTSPVPSSASSAHPPEVNLLQTSPVVTSSSVCSPSPSSSSSSSSRLTPTSPVVADNNDAVKSDDVWRPW